VSYLQMKTTYNIQ